MTELRIVGDTIEMDQQTVATLVPGLRLSQRDRLSEGFALAGEDEEPFGHPVAEGAVVSRSAAHKVVTTNAPKKETGREALVRENEDLWARVKKLERQVENGDGSLFDLRQASISERWSAAHSKWLRVALSVFFAHGARRWRKASAPK